MIHHIPSRLVYWSGWALLALTALWLLTNHPAAARLCAAVGIAYSAVSVLRPELMPRVTTELPPPFRVSERATLASHRLLGLGSVPIWIMAWLNRPVPIPMGLVASIGIGVAVAVVAQALFPRTGS